jgi:hypothetical protein
MVDVLDPMIEKDLLCMSGYLKHALTHILLNHTLVITTR